MRRKKWIHKLIIMHLIVCMLAIGFGASYISVNAATEVQTWNQYKADYYLDYSPYSYYMSDDFNVPYRTIVEENSKSDVFNGLLTAWQIATFELTDVVEYSKKRTG